MKSTQAMRNRIRELMTNPQDDYDRAIECVLDDLEAVLDNVLSPRCFSISEPYLSGWRLIIGFNTRQEVDAAQAYIASLPRRDAVGNAREPS
jgi:hypothetical protein